MTRHEVMEEIARCEAAGTFDIHVDPIPKEIVLPVTETYHYPNQRTLFEKVRYGTEKWLLVKPFTLYVNGVQMRTRYVGRENFRGLGAAVLTCNHFTKFDCLAVQHGARGHRTFVMAAPFNNMNSFLGELMRAGDMLPLSTTAHGNRNFNRMVEEVLTKRQDFLLVYPEAAMWWNYKKPRPYKNGAFSLAVKYNVPVVPQFVTMKEDGRYDDEGLPVPEMTVHITKPLYPDPALGRVENIERLKREAFEACRRIYEETYGIPLRYDIAAAKASPMSGEL